MNEQAVKMKKEKTILKEKAHPPGMDVPKREVDKWQDKYILLLEKYNHFLKNQMENHES